MMSLSHALGNFQLCQGFARLNDQRVTIGLIISAIEKYDFKTMYFMAQDNLL